jgi:integrase
MISVYRTFFWLAAETGLRAGALTGLTLEDIDVENRVVRVRQSVWRGRVQSPKTANALREFAISEPLAERLSDQLLARTSDPVRLLWRTSRGTPWDANLVVKRKLHPLLAKLGITRTGLHAFRHGNATILDRNHVPVKLRQTRLGHSDIRMSIGRYAHVVGENDRKIASTLGELLKPPITEVIQ